MANTLKQAYPVIRNEKVGCSIHLSGTNTDKGSFTIDLVVNPFTLGLM